MVVDRDPEGTQGDHLRTYADVEGARVLEVGCGSGFVMRRYAASAYGVVGIDTNHDALVQAHLTNVSEAHCNIRVGCAEGEHLPFADATFSTVIFGQSLWWIARPGMVHALDALQEAWRVLIPDGTLCDVHPHSPFIPLEIAIDEQRLAVGFLAAHADPMKGMERVIAASNALAIAVHERHFVLEQREVFFSDVYWDSVEDASAYYETTVTDVQIPDTLQARATDMLQQAGEGARVSARRTLLISRYRKQSLW